MDDDSRFFITGRDVDRHIEAEQALLEFTRLFGDESNDRAMVIVGAAFLDTQLDHVLETFLVDDAKEVERLLNIDQPLGTSGARIRAAYCLGLIGPMVRDDLRIVAKIRNRFAHFVEVSFHDQQIVSWCQALKFHRVAHVAETPGVKPRDLFNVGVNKLVCHLSGVVSIARGERRQIRPM